MWRERSAGKSVVIQSRESGIPINLSQFCKLQVEVMDEAFNLLSQGVKERLRNYIVDSYGDAMDNAEVLAVQAAAEDGDPDPEANYYPYLEKASKIPFQKLLYIASQKLWSLVRNIVSRDLISFTEDLFSYNDVSAEDVEHISVDFEYDLVRGCLGKTVFGFGDVSPEEAWEMVPYVVREIGLQVIVGKSNEALDFSARKAEHRPSLFLMEMQIDENGAM